MAHARLSPSNTRWPICAGSVREEAKYPVQPGGAAAIDGTGSHLLLEMCIKSTDSADIFIGETIGINHPEKPGGWTVDAERARRVNDCLAYLDNRVNELKAQYPDCEISVESESKSNPGLMFGRDDWYGTCDITIIAAQPFTGLLMYLETIDYKDGRGFVAVKDNTQLISYGGGKLVGQWEPGHPQEIRTTVVQPKTTPVVRFVDYTTETFMTELNALAEAAKRTDDPDAPLTPGNHCKYCAHKPHCTAGVSDSVELLESINGDVIKTLLTDVTTLTGIELAKLMDARPAIEAVFVQVEKELQQRIEQQLPEAMNVGYEMQPGKSSKEWAEDDDAIIRMLRARKFKKSDYYPEKLVTPAAALKHPNLTESQREAMLKKYITVKKGKKKLARVRHIKPDVNTMFGDVASFDDVGDNHTAAPATVSFL